MSEMTLKPNEKLDVRNILKDLDKYEPKRRGWTWRKPAPNLEMGPFTYHDDPREPPSSTEALLRLW